MSEQFKINIVTNYRYYTLQEIYETDFSYLLYLIQTHKTCDQLKEVIYDFLKSKNLKFD
jgi:hypothetical protein